LEFDIDEGKVGEIRKNREKSRKLWFACENVNFTAVVIVTK